MNNDLKYSFPWHGNDIYLESNDKQVKAVCSNKDIAKYLAAAANNYEYRDDYLQTAIDFQKKTMSLIENTYAVNAAILAVDNTISALNELSVKHMQFVDQVYDISCKHENAVSSVVEISTSVDLIDDDISHLKNNVNKFANEYERVNNAIFTLNNTQQLATNNLLTATAMQQSLSKKLNQLSVKQNALRN